MRYACVRDPRVVTPAGVFFIRFHADRLVIPLKPMDGKMTVPQQHALFPNALSDVLGTLNTAPSDRLAVAPGCRGAGPARVRNVSLSKRLTPGGNKEKATLWTLNPKKQEPEIVPPAPVVEPARNVPEIPPDKDTPEKRSPVQAKAGLIAS